MSQDRETGQSSRAYLSLGSNLGDRRRHLSAALSQIELAGSRISLCSSVYETEPVDVREQPPFLNLVCAVLSPWEPHVLLHSCQKIEVALGRSPTFPKGPRIIDIDLLFFEDRMIRTRELVVPHPRLQERRFVLVPLAEIAARFIDPRSGRDVASLLESCPDPSWIREAGDIRW